MAHKAYINGTAYDVTKGRTKINGTGYDIVKGRTLINGTGYDISFVGKKPAGDYDVGDSVYLEESGAYVEYIVVQQGLPSGSYTYDSSCNGTWVLRKQIFDTCVWATYANSDKGYNSSTLRNCLNATTSYTGAFYVNLGDKEKAVALSAKYPYWNVENEAIQTLTQKVLAPSVIEVGIGSGHENTAAEGNVLAYFSGINSTSSSTRRKAYLGSTATAWWTRSTNTAAVQSTGNEIEYAWCVGTTGNIQCPNKTSSKGMRPMLILDSDAVFDAATNRLI